VLVDMRARLARSQRPKRIFEVSLAAAREAGVVSARRVLDSTPLYDAVATQDTVTMIRSAIRQLLAAADAVLEAELRGVLRRDDDYGSGGKPICDWDDPAAREHLVAELAGDGYACLQLLEDRDLAETVSSAAELLATVLGQDLEQGDDGRFRIARRVAKDRVISTVDPDARHGHKTQAHGFDGYKGHVAVDPDSEIITATTVTPANTGDASVATDLIADVADDRPSSGAKVYGDSAYGTGSSNSTSTITASSRGAAPSPPHRPRAGCSPKTTSRSISTMTPSPARRGKPWTSTAGLAVTGSRGLVTCAGRARCVRPARPRRRGARSRSAGMKRPWPRPAPSKPTRPGGPMTGRCAPKSNASSLT
jgi:hypothetical protein